MRILGKAHLVASTDYGSDTDVRCSIFLMAFVTSLEGQTVISLSVYATSAFSTHSLISTVYVVQGVVYGMDPYWSCQAPPGRVVAD